MIIRGGEATLLAVIKSQRPTSTKSEANVTDVKSDDFVTFYPEYLLLEV